MVTPVEAAAYQPENQTCGEQNPNVGTNGEVEGVGGEHGAHRQDTDYQKSALASEATVTINPAGRTSTRLVQLHRGKQGTCANPDQERARYRNSRQPDPPNPTANIWNKKTILLRRNIHATNCCPANGIDARSRKPKPQEDDQREHCDFWQAQHTKFNFY